MKILFATCHSEFLDNEYVFPYLGVLSLLGIAAKSKKVKIVWQDQLLTPELRDSADVFYVDNLRIPFDQYNGFDVYCFSVFTPQYQEARKVMQRLKDANSNSKFTIGGSHATYYGDLITEDGWDLIVANDGEEIIKRLIDGELNFSDYDHNKRVSSVIRKEQLDKYPIPYRHRGHLMQYKYELRGRRATTLVSARGCPNKCAFCESRLTTCRRESVERFKAEVSSIVEDCLFPNIMIFDDIFALSPAAASPYVAVMKSMNRKYDTLYRCFVHANIITRHPEMIEMLKDSGCVEVGFGAESASNDILANVFKGTTVQEYHEMIRAFICSGIRVKAFFMLGLPGETRETAEATRSFIKMTKDMYPEMFDFDCTIFFPYRGTYIGDSLREGRKDFDLRLQDGIDWKDVDSGLIGAYKMAKGCSDIVVESYSHKEGKVLFSHEELFEMQDTIMSYSRRY